MEKNKRQLGLITDSKKIPPFPPVRNAAYISQPWRKTSNLMIKMSNNTIQKLNSGSQACAACKYQRRKCSSDCLLAPYFPQSRQGQFINAHKLFGVSNITKIIRHLEPALKDEAMRTIIFQADARANDPVGGCYRIIQELQHHIDYYTAELELVHHHLALYRAQEAHGQGHVRSNVQAEPEDQNNKSQYRDYPSSCEERHDSYGKNNCQEYITQNNQVLVEGFSSYGMQEPGFNYVPFLQQNCIDNEGDDNRHLLGLPIDRVEFRFGLEDEEESNL